MRASMPPPRLPLSPTFLLYLVLLVLLPVEGTEHLRVEIWDVAVSIVDLLLAAVLYADFVEGTLTGARLGRFPRIACGLAAAAAALSGVSLLYVPMEARGYDLKVTLNLLQLLALVYLSARVVRDHARLRLALLAVAAGAAVVAAATVLAGLGLEPGGLPVDERGAGDRLGPFRLGLVGLTSVGLSFSTVVLLAFPIGLQRGALALRPLRAILAAVLALAAAISYSRGLWVAMAIQLCLWIGFGLLDGRLSRRVAAGAAAAVLLLVVAAEGGEVVPALAELRPETVARRLNGYLLSLEVLAEGPVELLFGAGKGYFAATADYGMVPHNLVLELLVSKGVVTTIAFLALVGGSLASLWRVARRGGIRARALAVTLFVALAGLLAEGMVAPIATSLTFLVGLGLAAALVGMEEGAADRREVALGVGTLGLRGLRVPGRRP